MIKFATGLLLAVALVSAQAPPRTLTITSGRGELLQFEQDIKEVAASEPKIADVVVVTPRAVMVNAKEPGKTTIVVWENGQPIRYNIDVVADSTDFDNFRRAMSNQ